MIKNTDETLNNTINFAGESYCSALSLQSGESMHGSATRSDIYLLLEYPGAWGEKAIPGSRLPASVKERLAALQKEIPYCKALLIRSNARHRGDRIHFFVAQTHQDNPRLFSFLLDNYPDLLALDIPTILDGSPAYEANRCEGPLYLVCTNGRRDKCCAKFGLPVYKALQGKFSSDGKSEENLPLKVWQSSHIGGHRFAVNLLVLPSGLLYGRIGGTDVEALIAATQDGQMLPQKLRGRTCYEPPVQAAEILLRDALGEAELDALRFEGLDESGPGGWQVRFEHTITGERHSVEVRSEISEELVYQGCTLDKQSAIQRYSLAGHPSSPPTSSPQP